jgi:hypothetical protein
MEQKGEKEREKRRRNNVSFSLNDDENERNKRYRDEGEETSVRGRSIDTGWRRVLLKKWEGEMGREEEKGEGREGERRSCEVAIA